MTELHIKQCETIPANYATKNGLITIVASGGKKSYLYSIDDGLTWQNKRDFDVFGGTYNVIVKDSLGNMSNMFEAKVGKVLSTIQAEYLNNLFDCFGNESQAAMQTVTQWDKSAPNPNDWFPISFLPPRTVHNWRKDADFAVFVRELKLEANDYEKDYLEAKLQAHINGGIPIYQWIPNPCAEMDENGNPVDVTDRIRIQIGETLPSEKSLHFKLERKFKDTYSNRTEVTGKNGNELGVISIAVSEDFMPELESGEQ